MADVNDLVERVADAIYGKTSDRMQRDGDLRAARAAIRIVAEEAARCCDPLLISMTAIDNPDGGPLMFLKKYADPTPAGIATRIRLLIAKDPA